MKLWDRYFTPSTTDEAAGLLAQYNGRACVVGGGTDLLLEIRQGNHPPVEALIDVTQIEELSRISTDSSYVFIGAAVTHSQVVHSDILVKEATSLVESCGVVGGPQVRNVGTLGGNVVHALPAADGTTSLVALDAEAEIFQKSVRRWRSIRELFKGPAQSLVDPTADLLLQFRVKRSSAGQASAFKRIMRPQGVALPVLACAVWVGLDAARQKIEEARVCIGPVAPIPTRISGVEAALCEQVFGPQALAGAVAAARRELHPRTSSYRATAEYRMEMVEVLLRRVVTLAVHRAQTGECVPEGLGL